MSALHKVLNKKLVIDKALNREWRRRRNDD